MNTSGDAAEQVVRLSLEGMEVTAKLTGTAAKHIAIILLSILKQEHKTRGKARLTSMIKSGKELKVFAVPQQDLKTFVNHAKQYGVLYCVLKDKNNTAPNAIVDVIARAEDAAKIQRIFDRFEIGKVQPVTLDDSTENTEPATDESVNQKEDTVPFAETMDKAEERLQSEGSLESAKTRDSKKESVREKINKYKHRQRRPQPEHDAIRKEVVNVEK